VSRAAADHGLMPRLFARTRAGDTPVAGLIVSGLLGSAMIVLTAAPTLGEQFGTLIDASTLFCLLTYLAACAATLRYRLPGERVLALVGGAFCVLYIAGSSPKVLLATGLCLLLFALFYLPRRRRGRPDDLIGR
jgi:arginine:agmatine antiporter